MTAFVANTNVLDLIGVKDEVADTFINDAVVSVTIKDSTGENVAGETWPLTMAYVAASNGDYRGILSADILFTPKKKYVAYIEVDGGADLVGHWEFEFKPITREAND